MTSTVRKATYDHTNAKRALVPLLVIFILGTLCLQAFNLVFAQVGQDLGAPEQAPLITAIPGIVLGIVCFVYGSLGDFVSLKRMTVIGLALLVVGSLMGFFLHMNIWLVIIARAIQTAGAQVSGSVYLVVAAKYLRDSEKVVFFGIFTAGYQLSTAIGVVAGGFLSEIDWSYLFLIPVISVLFIPILMKNLPEINAQGVKVDVPGFLIFGLAIAFLTLFFSDYQWLFLAAAAVLFVVFALYINKAKDPFITPAFFRNSRWLKAISLIFVFYFINYSFSPLYNAIGTSVYNLKPAQVSLVLLASFIVATVVATSSGAIIGKIGREAAIFTAAGLMIVGLVASALCVMAGTVALAITGCVFYAGMGLMFSPIVDTVLSTVPAEQTGRGIGMNDLVMNVTASIGIAIFGGLMGTQSLGGGSVIGATGSAAVYSNLLLIFAAIVLLGLVLYVAFRKRIYTK